MSQSEEYANIKLCALPGTIVSKTCDIIRKPIRTWPLAELCDSEGGVQ